MSLRSMMPFAGRAVSRGEDPFSQLHREVNRAFDDLWRGNAAGVPAATSTLGWNPTVDVKDEKDHLVVTAELPGVSEKDVSVTVDGDVLTLAGEKKSEREEKGKDDTWYLNERSWGSFRRAFTLPFAPAFGAIEATFANGVLTVKLPKPAVDAPKSKQIPIKAA